MTSAEGHGESADNVAVKPTSDPLENRTSGGLSYFGSPFRSHNRFASMCFRGPGCQGGGIGEILCRSVQEAITRCPQPSHRYENVRLEGKCPSSGLCVISRWQSRRFIRTRTHLFTS